MKRKIPYYVYDYILIIIMEITLKMTIEHLLQVLPFYRNLRDIEVSFVCKLHNNTQLVTSHCILMSLAKYGCKNKKPY